MQEPLEILRKHWGYTSFRPMQREIIDSVLAGHDTLGLLPTGAGKSITFQVPGLALGGLTLVVTPLVALMKDQVDNLNRHGIRAAFMHASMTYAQRSSLWQSLVQKRCKFLYIAPERLGNERFLDELRMLKSVSLVVVDEAHCISQWGYDFRPSYLEIAKLRKTLPSGIPFLALTASATPQVADDICRVLKFRSAAIFRTSFARPNISYVVRSGVEKISHTLHILAHVPGTAIVYVRSRRKTVEIASELKRAGVDALPFHAGLEYNVKEQRINDWKSGKCRVIVATNAFGMGIDKPDVRMVIHLSIPPSLEEYYQEAGRAGRDGLPSYAVMIVTRDDITQLRRQLTLAFPSRETIKLTYERVCNYLHIALEEGAGRIVEFDMEDFCNTFRMHKAQVENSLALLGSAGYMEYLGKHDRTSKVQILRTREDLYSLVSAAPHSDAILRALLRECPGIFADLVPMDETLIAHDASCNPDQVYDIMLSLAKEKTIKYIPRRHSPVIFLPTSREEPKYLLIPKSIYEARKKMLEMQMEAMIGFVRESQSCRANKILNYFGQTDNVPCGTCDNCRAAKRNKV